ncbi:hypothetical protein B0H13DRAFT_2530301 [Mycena leptocephala]|nr:hypothetical protein B0H13DRAFT_2530301 [Mycena leptocephala]
MHISDRLARAVVLWRFADPIPASNRILLPALECHYYKAIVANIIVNPPLATELICKRMALTSRLVSFSGSIFPGQREERDPNLSDGVPPPFWLATELGVVQMAVEYDEGVDLNPSSTPISDDDDDSGLVVKELEVDEDHIVQLMDHLSTFDDS